jgi:hypothetical protein
LTTTGFPFSWTLCFSCLLYSNVCTWRWHKVCKACLEVWC